MNRSGLDKLSIHLSFRVFLAILAALTFYVYRDYLLLDKLYLFKDIGSDTINVFYPRLIHIADYLRTEGLPMWSFNQGMGQNIFPGSLGNPFEWPLFALGSERLAYGIAYMEALKVILGGVFFYLYLRLFSLGAYVCVIGGLLYAFSGFMILGSGWYIFSAQAVYVALMLYATERYLRYQDWRLIPVAVALIGAGFTFHLYTTGVFFLVYSVFRYCDQNGFHLKKVAAFVLRLAGWGSLGLLISAVFIIASAQEILLSDRVSGEGSLVELLRAQPLFGFASEAGNVSAIMRAFSNNILGIGSNYQGASNYLEAPLFYGGVASLLLAPQVFIFLNKRQRYLYGGIAIIFILPVVFPYFRYAFWLFSGDYFRILSLFVVVIMLIFSLRALRGVIVENRINGTLLAVTLAVLLAALLYPYDLSGRHAGISANTFLKWATAGFLTTYALLIFGLSRIRHKNNAAVLLLLIVCVELVMTASMTANERAVIGSKEYASRTGYNDYSLEAIQYIKDNDPGFYRIEKAYSSGPAMHKSLNDARIQGYWGTSSYHSFNLGSYLEFLESVDLLSARDNRLGRRWLGGLNSRPILLSFASVKYMLVKDEKSFRYFSNVGFRGIKQYENVHIMENLLALPFGFLYDSYISEEEFMKLGTWQKEVALIKAVVLGGVAEKSLGTRFKSIKGDEIVGNFDKSGYVKDIQERRDIAMEIEHFSQNEIIGRISQPHNGLLFFSIPFDAGWYAEVDNMPTELYRVNHGFMGIALTPGEHSIILRYRPPYLAAGTLLSLLGLFAYFVCLYLKRQKA